MVDELIGPDRLVTVYRIAYLLSHTDDLTLQREISVCNELLGLERKRSQTDTDNWEKREVKYVVEQDVAQFVDELKRRIKVEVLKNNEFLYAFQPFEKPNWSIEDTMAHARGMGEASDPPRAAKQRRLNERMAQLDKEDAQRKALIRAFKIMCQPAQICYSCTSYEVCQSATAWDCVDYDCFVINESLFPEVAKDELPGIIRNHKYDSSGRMGMQVRKAPKDE